MALVPKGGRSRGRGREISFTFGCRGWKLGSERKRKRKRGDSSLAAPRSKQATLIEMHAIAVQAESVWARSASGAIVVGLGRGCASDARGGEGLGTVDVVPKLRLRGRG